MKPHDNDFYFLSYFIICLIFLSVVYTVSRLIRDANDVSVPSQVWPPVAEEKMVIAFNPLLTSLDKNGTLIDGVNITLTSETHYHILSCWGVSINELFLLIRRKWETLHSLVQNSSLAMYMDELCVCVGAMHDIHANENTTITLRCDTDRQAFGVLPRHRYPLVLFCFSHGLVQEQLLEPNEIIFQVIILHIRDHICTAESHVMFHLVRTKDQPFHDLKALFMSENPDVSDGSPCGTQSKYQCVVCQNNSVTEVFLPCRHACVCQDCHTKLDECPICRSHIIKYFKLIQD